MRKKYSLGKYIENINIYVIVFNLSKEMFEKKESQFVRRININIMCSRQRELIENAGEEDFDRLECIGNPLPSRQPQPHSHPLPHLNP